MKQSIKIFTDEIKKRDETDNEKLDDLKGMLETMISERSDQSVITDGLAKLKTLDKTTLSDEEFPEDVKELAKLMTKRFGKSDSTFRNTLLFFWREGGCERLSASLH